MRFTVAESDDELMGIAEISQMAKVSPQAVANWRVRQRGFPTPVASLKSGPVFRSSQVRAWLRRRVPMAHVISFINLKGGVAKTTTTIAVAEILAGEYGKDVLVVDLDPQTNATIQLISEDTWEELDERGDTLARLFEDALDPDHARFDLNRTLQKGVSYVRAVRTLDLLPSSLKLIDIQDSLATISGGKFYAQNPIDILRKAIKPILDDYDYVLIDCPPNLGIITLNGLRISEGYIIPTIPDVLSTYGIPQIVRRVGQFSDAIAEEIEPLGIVVTKYQAGMPLHNRTISELRRGRDANVFKTVIPQRQEIAEAAEFTSVSTLRQKWGYRGEYSAFEALTEEIVEVTAA